MRKLRLIGPIRPIRLIGLISLIGPIGLIGLMSILASCSKDHVEEPEQEFAISFNAGLQESTEVTRTEIALEDLNITAFKVWAFKNKGEENGSYTNPECVFPCYTVSWTASSAHTTTTNSDGWEYVDGEEQTIKYWDLAAKAYKFFGYAPASTHVKTEFNRQESWDEYEPLDPSWTFGTQYSKCRLSVPVDANDEEHAHYISRMWFATGNELQTKFSQPVKLEFFKPLAKVRFMFTFSDMSIIGENKEYSTLFEALQYTVEDPVFRPTTPNAGIAMSGEIYFEYPLSGTSTSPSWEINPSKPISYMTGSDGLNAYFTEYWYELTAAEKTAAEAAGNTKLIANQEKWYTVLPNKNQGNYTLTALINGVDESVEVPSIYMDWNPGYSYTYIFKIMPGGDLKFDDVQVAIKNWIVMTPGDPHKVYNW